MKTAIETLVRAWVIENDEFIDDNFSTIEDWMLDSIGEDNWMYDYFDSNEVEHMSNKEMEEAVREFASRYRIKAAEFLLFNTYELIGGVATFNADPFCIENEELAKDVLSCCVGDYRVLMGSDAEFADSCAKLDCKPSQVIKIYAFEKVMFVLGRHIV